MSTTNTWIAEQQKRRDLAVGCADALAKHLSGEWVRCDPHDHHIAIRSGDRRLTVRASVNGTVYRLQIDADLPEGHRTHTRLEAHRTTVAANRPAKAIAAQVRRRLLTEAYDAAIRKVHARIEAARQREATLAAAVADFEALIPGAKPYSHDSEGITRFNGPGSLRGTIQVSSHSESADFELDWVPIDLARDLATLIGQRRNGVTARS